LIFYFNEAMKKMNTRKTTMIPLVPTRFLQRSIAALLFSIIMAQTGYGQMQLMLYSPDHGSTGLGTDVTIELVFSDPIDTTAEYDISDGFYLGIEMMPQPDEEPTILLSNGDRTLTVHLELEPDTQYWVYLSGAMSTTGQSLDRPHVFTFSTGAVLPAGSISGRISYDDGNVLHAIVGASPYGSLFSAEEDEGDGSPVMALTVVTDPAGAYTIDYVPDGENMLLAFQDTNSDGEPGDGEGFGTYDVEQDRFADSVTLIGGEQLEGYDVSLETIQPVTAQVYFPVVATYAQNMYPDAGLAGVFGVEIEGDGTSTIWGYYFYSETEEISLNIMSFASLLFETESTDIEVEYTGPISDGWLDSDVIMGIAESNGGSEFRATNDDVSVMAILGALVFGDENRNQKKRNGLFSAILPAPPDHIYSLSEQVLKQKTANETTMWSVVYLAEANMLFVIIDAYTGDIEAAPGLATSAGNNRDSAEESVSSWAADAQLMAVGAVGEEGIDEAGASSGWAFSYYSPSLDEGRTFYLSAGFSMGNEEISLDMFPSLNPLPSTWVDSPVAVAEAEANSGNFRSQYPDAIVSASLSRGQRESAPDRPVWRFTYFSQLAFQLLIVDVDAVSGLAITAVDDGSIVPEEFVLYQAYPNPFNPSTTISFQTPDMERVKLSIYNITGQEIATLIEAVLPAGVHEVNWRPDGLSGGVYYYRLETKTIQRTRSLVLLK